MIKRPSTDLIPQVTLDCVIFGFHDGQLKVLLIKWKETTDWSLPGGPVMQAESIDNAANRVLFERTQLDRIFLKQYHTYGEHPRYNLESIKEKLKHLVAPEIWYERAISVAYYALVDYSHVSPTPDSLTDECRWWDIDDLPELLFDHNNMVTGALKALRMELSHQPIGYNLMPEKFTMPELQRLYEAILGTSLDPRNFYKKIKSLNILNRLNERKKGGAHRAPYMYKFDKEEYQNRLKERNLTFN